MRNQDFLRWIGFAQKSQELIIFRNFDLEGNVPWLETLKASGPSIPGTTFLRQESGIEEKWKTRLDSGTKSKEGGWPSSEEEEDEESFPLIGGVVPSDVSRNRKQ